METRGPYTQIQKPHPLQLSSGTVYLQTSSLPLPIFAGLAGCSVLVGIWATLTGGIFHALSTPGSPPPRSCWGLTSPRNQFFAGQAALLLAAGLFYLVTQQVGAFLVVVECVVVE